MLRAKLSVVYTFVLFSAALVIAGCSSTPTVDKTLSMTPQAIYADAQDSMSAGQWDKAIPMLEKLEARAAGTPLAQQAQLDKAYAQFRTGEPVQAITTLDRFMKLHPASPALDYALYLKGIINFNDDLGLFSSITRQDMTERDQKAAKESYESFKELRNRFPDSKYSVDAGQRMNYIVSSLAQYEVHVARYYYKRGAYIAALNRAQTALNDYREVPAQEEALYILYKSYDALGMDQLRDDTKRLLEANYPQSEFMVKGERIQETPWWRFW
jgi:outer membrane protein assembly factor BamD